MRRINQNIKLPSGKAISYDYSKRVIEKEKPVNVQKIKTIVFKPKHVAKDISNLR